MKGRLFLLPNAFDEEHDFDRVIPVSVKQAVLQIQGLIAESEKMGRRYLRKFLSHEQMSRLPIRILSEHTKEDELKELLSPIIQGEIWGLVSDAGLPCIADPGANLVALAHMHAIDVQTFVGPCSLIMALQLSGFPAQQFSFHGYLPREKEKLVLKLQELEKYARAATQIWIEAPYRSSKMLEVLLENLHPATKLCVAASLEYPDQKVVVKSVAMWKKSSLDLSKEPAIFLISAK